MSNKQKNTDFVLEIGRLLRQLGIATYVLEKYANPDFEEYSSDGRKRGNAARIALVCIKGNELDNDIHEQA